MLASVLSLVLIATQLPAAATGARDESQRGARPADIAATVKRVGKSVVVDRGGELKVLRRGDAIRWGEPVISEGQSELEIAVGKVTFGPYTAIEFDRNTDEIRIHLSQGRVDAAIRPASVTGYHFSIRTANSIISALGTIYTCIFIPRGRYVPGRWHRFEGRGARPGTTYTRTTEGATSASSFSDATGAWRRPLPHSYEVPAGSGAEFPSDTETPVISPISERELENLIRQGLSILRGPWESAQAVEGGGTFKGPDDKKNPPNPGPDMMMPLLIIGGGALAGLVLGNYLMQQQQLQNQKSCRI
ncbi:MAG: hypothetical protein DMF86_05430 [Acidobacteria bacterium]|nr:MAG: hypothetical protein DMF86_05430 [Acidobacteriota bacterium]